METAGVQGGSFGVSAFKHGIPQPADPGKRPPIPSGAKAGQVEYRCKHKAYSVTVHRSAPQPVMTPSGMSELPEILVRIQFTPTFNGYGSYILGSDPNGSKPIQVSRPGGLVTMTADELRAEWFNEVLSDPEKLSKAGFRTGALWRAGDEQVLYLKAKIEEAAKALMVPGVLEGVMAIRGDMFQIDPNVGKTVKPPAKPPVQVEAPQQFSGKPDEPPVKTGEAKPDAQAFALGAQPGEGSVTAPAAAPTTPTKPAASASKSKDETAPKQ